MIALDFCPATPCTGHSCPDYQQQTARDRNMSLGLWVEAGLTVTREQIEHGLRQSLEWSRPTTAAGVAHQMPDAPFQVHAVANDDGSTTYVAVYSGDEPVDALLSRAPLFVEASAQ